MIVKGFDRKIVFPGHFTDGSQDDRRQAVCLRHVRHRAANATVAVISFQSALAPFIRRGEQLDYLVHLAHALVESEPDTIERHGLPPCQRTHPKITLGEYWPGDNASKRGAKSVRPIHYSLTRINFAAARPVHPL